jgi:hypothetical protein
VLEPTLWDFDEMSFLLHQETTRNTEKTADEDGEQETQQTQDLSTCVSSTFFITLIFMFIILTSVMNRFISIRIRTFLPQLYRWTSYICKCWVDGSLPAVRSRDSWPARVASLSILRSDNVDRYFVRWPRRTNYRHWFYQVSVVDNVREANDGIDLLNLEPVKMIILNREVIPPPHIQMS